MVKCLQNFFKSLKYVDILNLMVNFLFIPILNLFPYSKSYSMYSTSQFILINTFILLWILYFFCYLSTGALLKTIFNWQSLSYLCCFCNVDFCVFLDIKCMRGLGFFYLFHLFLSLFATHVLSFFCCFLQNWLQLSGFLLWCILSGLL